MSVVHAAVLGHVDAMVHMDAHVCATARGHIDVHSLCRC